METYDILMLIVLAAATLFGAIKGFAWQLASIGSIVVSYLVAYHFREPFSESIRADPPWNRFLAMLILYVGTSLVIWVIFRMISRTIDRMRLKEFDRQIGALFGLAKGALYCTLITLFAVTLLGDGLRERIVGSKSGHYIAGILNKSRAVIPPELQEVVQPVLEKFDRRFNEPGSGSGGFLPTWPGGSSADGLPTGRSGGDGGSLSEAVWNRLGQNGQPTTPPPWQSSHGSTPIDDPIEQQRFDTNSLRQSYGRPQQQSPPPWDGGAQR